LFGGGGAGGSGSSTTGNGGDGAQGAIFISYLVSGATTATGSFFMMFR
jgi:hypothetical protein